ncbi:hypothetical protein JW865_05685 [Candidatus Bathyarchaeota archaeon]|nr:hypothetical protein [Candidatus Bathyarchaeota archaeon]
MGSKDATEVFMKDIDSVVQKILKSIDSQYISKIIELRNDLEKKHKENRIKINHSVMELICAAHLIESGFNVKIEEGVNGISVDVAAEKGLGTLMVELETGFVPPENAVDPLYYLKARVASKIVRYSGYSSKFVLGTPPYYILQIPPCLTKPPRFRTDEEILAIKKLCDLYYTHPPVTLEEIRNARLHSIFIVDVDNVTVKEWEVSEYLGKASLWRI